MQFYPHRTVEEQSNRLPQELREAYKNSQLDRITISDGETELEVTGYAEYSYLEEKSYKEQPVRTSDGKIPEIEEYATFLTPRLIIKYNMMGIDDYRALMKMIKRKNSFVVTCYDVVEDKIVSKEMYVAPTSMPIIYQQYLIALGIQEFTIEFIGTNNEKSTIEFYIGDYKYGAEDGQTWGEWVLSKYNTNNNILYKLVNTEQGLVVSDAGDKAYVSYYYNDPAQLVKSMHNIVNGMRYSLYFLV